MSLKSVLHDILDVLEGEVEKSIPEIRSKVEQLGSEEIEHVVQDVTNTETTPVAMPEASANPAGGIPAGGLHPDATAVSVSETAPKTVDTSDDVPVSDTDPETDKVTVDDFVSSATPEQLSSLAAFIGANYPPESA